jgi:hypothetical protein
LTKNSGLKVWPGSVRCYTSWCEDLAPSRSHAERGQPAHPCYLPPPPTQMGQDGQWDQHAKPPPHQCLPPSRGRWRYQAGRGHTIATLPYLPDSPFTGVDDRLRRGRDRQQQYTTLPAGSDPSLSSAAPSWARVV